MAEHRRLRGRPVVLHFYPTDDTPGCTREACGFRDARARRRRRDRQDRHAATLRPRDGSESRGRPRRPRRRGA